MSNQRCNKECGAWQTHLGANEMIDLGGIDLLQTEADNDNNPAAQDVALLRNAQPPSAAEERVALGTTGTSKRYAKITTNFLMHSQKTD